MTQLSDLPSQLSYNTLPITPALSLARRSLFDIRQQLMAESSTTNENDRLIASISSGDLSSGTYEGGFKTWECAIDLASLLTGVDLAASPTTTPLNVIELGAGSAIPSLAVIRQYLSQTTPAPSSVKLTLCDYNADVLKLCTAPNVFLNYHLHPQSPSTGSESAEQDLDLEPLAGSLPCIAQQMKDRGIDISFISGAWGPDFFSLLKPMLCPPSPSSSEAVVEAPRILILASETIYSPTTLPDFVGTMIGLLSLGAEGSRALVAAKKVYFGVGGGVAEFEREVEGRGALVRTIWDSGESGGVGRVVLEVALQR